MDARARWQAMTVSAVAHAAVLIAAAFSAPSVQADSGGVGPEPSAAQPFLVFASGGWAEPEAEEGGPAEVAAVGTEGDPSKCGGRAPKAMGSPVARASLRFGIAGPLDNPDPHVATRSGVSSTGDSETGGGRPRSLPNALTMAWGRDEALGNDEQSARGGMWGDATGDGAGADGMAIAGRCDECGGSAGTSSAETSEIGGIVRRAIGLGPVLGRGAGLARGYAGTIGSRAKR